MNLETEKPGKQLEADELDEMRYRVAAGAFVVNVQSKRRHCRRKRHDRDRNAVIQT